MYIDSSTFWVIAIGLGVAVGVVWYKLDTKINKTYEILNNFLKQLCEVIDKEFENVRNESLRSNADVLNKVADAFETIEKAHNK